MTRDAICEGMRAARAKETSHEMEWRITVHWFSLSFIDRVRVEKHTDKKKREGHGCLPLARPLAGEEVIICRVQSGMTSTLQAGMSRKREKREGKECSVGLAGDRSAR